MVQGVERAGRTALVTGATGFVGGAIVARLAASGGRVRAAVRGDTGAWVGNVTPVRVGDLGTNFDWAAALTDVDVVVHAAARVHVMRESAADPLTEFRRVNVAGTLALAQQCVDAGVQRFVFISSIKVNGEGTEPARPYKASDSPQPKDPYGVSKAEAEEGLRALSARTGLEVVIVRPVLVYGLGVKGNFASMLRWIRRGVPLPLGGVKNRRSLVALDNLVDLVTTVMDHSNAPGRTFLVSDGDDLSTPELLRRAAAAMGRSATLLPVPPGLLTVAGALIGQSGVVQRLCGSLQVDVEDTCVQLGWRPPVSVDEALRRTVHGFSRSPR